jgi:probable phosphoglycerate mutase
MTTIALLIRHAHTAVIGHRLVGRLPGIMLSDEGCAQVERLRSNVRLPLAAVYSSPLERALDTARPLADDRQLAVIVRGELDELDFGVWTGMSFAELQGVAAWREFNAERSRAAVPGGERAADAQARMVGFLDNARIRHTGATFAVVSHAEVIRGAVLWYAGRSLDRFSEIDIDPASVTAVGWTGDTPRLLFVNRREGVESSTELSRASHGVAG